MSEEKKLKVGDRVRLKEYYEFTCANELTYIDVDEVGIVKAVHGGYIEIDFSDMPVWLEFHEDEIELVESYDPKTAFLSELKGLLEKYGAKMSADVSGPDLDCAEVDMLFLIGDDEIRFNVSMFNSFITPDNMMDYDKE